MAKKLLVGNYRFDAVEGIVYLKENIPAERILLITNVTRNIIIYNFSSATEGYSAISYDGTTNETAFSLKYSTAAMQNTDKLQIFIQGDYQEITPAEDVIDPVGKIRVSTPENLIDTDFEYGMQGTKWETVQTVNNIPTIFSNSGDTPLDGITSVNSSVGDKSIKVTTSISHNLSVGDPIAVQGLSIYQAEGFFIVTSVPSTTEFFFEIDVAASSSGDISGSYTTIVPGKFFEGSTLPVSTSDGAITDAAASSTVTVTTKETHGLSAKTKVYLRNTIGPRVLSITDSTLTAPDSRPYVDTTTTFNTNNVFAMSTDTARGVAGYEYRKPPVVTYDWEGTYTLYLDPSAIDTANDRITWNTHNMRNGYLLLFQTPYEGLTDGGMLDGKVYWVKKHDANTIELHNSSGLNSKQSLSTLANTYGPARLTLVYKIEYGSGTTRKTTFNQWLSNQGSATATTSNNLLYGTTQNSTRTDNVNLSSLFGGGSVTNCKITDIVAGGDLNSTHEYISITMAGHNQYIFSPGNQSSNFMQMAISPQSPSGSGYSTPIWEGMDISSYITQSGGQSYFQVSHWCNSSVGPFTMPPYCYKFKITFQKTGFAGTPGESEKEKSGGDLYDSRYGLGGSQPSSVVGFQRRVPGSGSYTSQESFSYQANQRDTGRYATYGVRNTNTVTLSSSNPNSNSGGSFTINDSSSSWSNTGSEVYYAFCDKLTSDRNTIYKANHGVTSNQTVTVTVDGTNYSAGQRFAYVGSTGTSTDMGSTFQATLSAVNSNVLRLQTDASPNTDDITKIPENFTITYSTPNPTYNSLYIPNHKVLANATATYNNTSGTAIPPLTDGQSIVLSRLSDTRLKIFGGAASTNKITVVEEASNNNTLTNQFIDIETPLGFDPSTATITMVEFRGDFGWNSEYVTLTFTDSDVHIIGRYDDNGDTANYTTSTTFFGKDISSLLTTSGGKKGFQVTIAPSPGINFGPGGGPWWGLRFTVEGSSSGLLLTGSGTGGHTFNVANLLGSYDGIYNIGTIPSSKTFTMSAGFEVPIKSIDFTSGDVNNGDETITFANDHNFIPGEKVLYNNNGNTSITGTGIGTELYTIVKGDKVIKLATSASDALSDSGIDLTGQSGTHSIKSYNLLKNIKGSGSVSIVLNSKVITGAGTRFLSDFKRFDKIYIDNGTYTQEKTVDTVTSEVNMTLFETMDATANTRSYYYATQLALRPDGFSLHKPFDGGVDITAGTSPNSRICRQTRKYFRYQSGKGIQTSFAINFNPPRICKELVQAAGTTANVKTQEQHNLAVGDSVVIAGAVVSSGLNTYNGTFNVATVPDAFSFTYTMDSAPAQVKAAGFPTYVRSGWTDSFVRAGMFDDQNGMFYEYDGQDLQAVRRSSTTQIAGTISVTRGSQIITGTNTSFTTQLVVGDSVVIRGQSYKIVEVSSDIRMVVQPEYRGINANAVKATKTVDTKTKQSDWSLDPGDGTGFTGFNLDTTKIQMGYMDYSWYGAGKIRYGFKDTKGHIKYLHEYIHNNRLDESYFRSGNLPARYEIENGSNSTTSPTLFHFGTSIIMDGTFDDDKAYQFTGESRPLAYTNGDNSNITTTAESTFRQITLGGERVFVYSFQVSQAHAQATTVGSQVVDGGSPQALPAGSYVTQVLVDGSSSIVYTNYPATSNDPTGSASYAAIPNSSTITVGESDAIELLRPLPLISVRLAPSVDSSLTGALGEREVVNRMQLRLQNASITCNQPIEFFLLQNTLPSDLAYVDAPRPSLSEVIKHKAGDTLIGGTSIYSSKAATGSVTVALTDLLEIGNSILGGDGIYPAGPDLLTLAVQPQDISGIAGTTPFTVSGKISWSESQA